MYSPYDYESVLIGAVLRFGRDAALAVLPQLTADKFIHNMGGHLGGSDNRFIWRAIETTVLVDRADPMLTTGAVRLHLTDEQAALAAGYANELIYKYKIETLDSETLRNYARRVHKQGIVYAYAQLGGKLSRLLDAETFAAYVEDKVDDAERWGAEVISEMHLAGGVGGDERYSHISEGLDEDKEVILRQYAGEQMFLLPVCVPVLAGHGLFPAESMAIVHGLSSGGKSTFVNMINLGTAIGLVHNKLSGCIAINSLEMSKRDVRSRWAAALAGFDTFKLLTKPQEVSKMDLDRYLEYLDFVSKLPLWMDDTPGIAIEQLTLRLAGVHLGSSGPVRQLSTDYLELFEGSSEESREQELGSLTAAHFAIRRNYHCNVIAVSQSTYNSKTFVAGMMGARYSRALTHKPDIVLELVNYRALKRSGTDYIVAEGLDEEHVWIMLQKYRGGPTDRKIMLGWEPEFTRLYDPSLIEIDSNVIMFEHLREVYTLLQHHPTTNIIPIQDTPLADL